MKRLLLLSLLFALALCAVSADAQWRCVYATYDDADSNGTGDQTASVGVIHNNMFIALIAGVNASNVTTSNFMLPYVDADSSVGRRYSYGYSPATSGIFQLWTDGAFDQVQMFNAFQIVATPDSFIYVANNDPDHNILVFKYTDDTITVIPPFQRQITGTNPIWGIDVDKNGYVYVCNDSTSGVTNDVKVYPPIAQWSSGHLDSPSSTIDLPDGVYKGITASPDGKAVFVSDYKNKKVLKFVGSPTTGYTQAAGFNFQLSAADTIPLTTGNRAGPLGLAYLSPNNIVAVACDSLHGRSPAYTYGRIYFIKPGDGSFISADTSVFMIDVAKWNFTKTGGYQDRPGGKTPGNASGYTSTYDVAFDANANLYSQSFRGWTIEKWVYSGTLPTTTGVQEIEGKVPGEFKLLQNYPNPFNPSTTIDFSLPKSGFVTLKVFNVLGQEVATLLNETREAGTYRVSFDARRLPSGMYMYTLRSGGYVESRKMLLVK